MIRPTIAQTEPIVRVVAPKIQIDLHKTWHCEECILKTDVAQCRLDHEDFYSDKEAPLLQDASLHADGDLDLARFVHTNLKGRGTQSNGGGE